MRLSDIPHKGLDNPAETHAVETIVAGEEETETRRREPLTRGAHGPEIATLVDGAGTVSIRNFKKHELV